MNKFLFAFFAFFLFQLTHAQITYKVSGTMLDAEDSSPLPGATVKIDKLKVAATTDANGYYEFNVPPGNYKVEAILLGYKKQVQEVKVTNADISLSFTSEADIYTTGEVIVNDQFENKNSEGTQMGEIELKMEEVKKLPALFGEVDILKTLQLLPGIKSSGEGNAGFYVRGGGPDQNLILLDNATVYNAAHLFGFFSVFNSDAVKDATIIKGGMPANYGGRLSSVLDIEMKEGDMQKWHGSGGIGPVAARATFHGPIVKDKLSFLVSGRRTFIDLFLPLFAKINEGIKGNSYYFVDVNAKLSWHIGKNDVITASGYWGQDVFKFRSPTSDLKIDIPWGNGIGTVVWKHKYSSQLFQTTTFAFTDYFFSTGADNPDFAFKLFSGIRDYSLKTAFDWRPLPNHNFKFGADYTFHEFTPSTATARFDSTEINPPNAQKLYAHDLGIYAMDEFSIGKVVKINLGVRFNYFQQAGPFNRFVKDASGVTQDTIKYGVLDNIADYARVEPRFSIRFRTGEHNSIKAAFTLNYQNLHLANFATVSLPTDVWLPSTSIVKPQQAMQGNLGFFQNFLDNKFEASVEVYYKWMTNLVEYRDNTSFTNLVNDNPDNVLAFGSGRSFGAEFFIKKRVGKWTGWIGYTLAWTQRYGFDKDLVNYEGEFFYPRYDRRHDLAVTLSWDITPRLNVAAVFVYSTGNVIAVPARFYFVGTDIVPQYDDRDNYRQMDYHRLDLSMTYVLNKSKKWSSNLNVSVYNVYSRMNPFFIYFDIKSDNQAQTVSFTGKQVSLFPIIPSITWNFNF